MEEENNRTETSIKTSPHRERICKCGCGESFIPKRRDQVYKNSRHANYAYNHGKRKQKTFGQKTAESQLRKNDKILEKYYKLCEKEVVIVFSLNLISDGFDHSFYIGNEIKEDFMYSKSYNYLFYEYEKNGRKLTRIIKQKNKVYVKR
tara:strand:+ start:2735 stop:3178 length:444 start_codon:yes stop_codon:yes gene_type:complete